MITTPRRELSGPTAGATFVKGLTTAATSPIVRPALLRMLGWTALALVTLLGLAIWGGFALVDAWAVEPIGEGWWSNALGLILKAALAIGLIMVVPVLVSVAASLMSPAWSDRVFVAGRLAAGARDPAPSPLSNAASAAVEIRRLLGFLAASALLLPLLLVPALGPPVYAALQFLLTSRTLGAELIGLHLERHGLGGREQRDWLARRRGVRYVVGALAAALHLVPLLQLAAPALCIAAAGAVSARLDGTARS